MEPPEDFGYEDRTKRLMERLDRIQNYLQSLPPLPKIGSFSASEAPKEQTKEGEARAQSAGQNNDDSEGSAGSSTTKRSVSTKDSRTVPKDDSPCKLQRQSGAASPEDSRSFPTSSLSNSSHTQSALEVTKTKKKRKRKDNRIQDPLRPTTRTSFGLDIGQGINAINYIKQNAMAGGEARNKRLVGIITKDPEPDMHSPASMDKIYRQGPLTADTSALSMAMRNKEASEVAKKAQKQAGISSPAHRRSPPSDTDIYRVRYQDRAVELPHQHGLDALQELFVPYMEHYDPLWEMDPPRPSTDEYDSPSRTNTSYF